VRSDGQSAGAVGDSQHGGEQFRALYGWITEDAGAWEECGKERPVTVLLGPRRELPWKVLQEGLAERQ
jgi:hypothetical protein